MVNWGLSEMFTPLPQITIGMKTTYRSPGCVPQLQRKNNAVKMQEHHWQWSQFSAYCLHVQMENCKAVKPTLTMHCGAVKWGRAAWLAANVSRRLCLHCRPSMRRDDSSLAGLKSDHNNHHIGSTINRWTTALILFCNIFVAAGRRRHFLLECKSAEPSVKQSICRCFGPTGDRDSWWPPAERVCAWFS